MDYHENRQKFLRDVSLLYYDHFFIFKDDGVTNARMTEGSGATAESQCGWLLFHDFHCM